jgi:8-oxo-dGTP pyrophosphatase MutT (NUDIX family)
MLHSYGLIVYREMDGVIEYLIARPSSFIRGRNNNAPYYFPKGGKNEGETFEQAACRETIEETGIEGKIVSDINFVRYLSGRKEIGLYLAEYVSGKVEADGECPQHDWENDDVRFVPFDEAMDLLRDEFKPLLEEVHFSLNNLAK